MKYYLIAGEASGDLHGSNLIKELKRINPTSTFRCWGGDLMKDQCNELMFSHATDARPNGYYWYKQADGNYTCSSKLPAKNISYTQCNRVEQQPLFDYLTDYQYGSYWYMNNPSIIGIHIEQLS